MPKPGVERITRVMAAEAAETGLYGLECPRTADCRSIPPADPA